MSQSAVVRHVTPVPADAATGIVTDVYEQSRGEIGRLVEAVTMFSPDPVLLVVTWAGFREPLMATGHAPRVGKEAVAAPVSKLNERPFCVDAHTVMLYGGSPPIAAALARLVEAVDEAAAGVLPAPGRELSRRRWTAGTANRSPSAPPGPTDRPKACPGNCAPRYGSPCSRLSPRTRSPTPTSRPLPPGVRPHQAVLPATGLLPGERPHLGHPDSRVPVAAPARFFLPAR